jgi:two-component system response regulator AtoC
VNEIFSEQGDLKKQLRYYEQVIIRTAIDKADGDRKLAADRLGIGVSSLYRKLDQKMRAET